MHEDLAFKKISCPENLEFICLLLEGYELTSLTYLTLVRELATLHKKHLYIAIFLYITYIVLEVI